MYNFIDINYTNDYGRWYGKDRYIFPKTKNNPLGNVERVQNPYSEIVVGFEPNPWYEDNTRDVECQLRCFKCTSVEEAFNKVKRFL